MENKWLTNGDQSQMNYTAQWGSIPDEPHNQAGAHSVGLPQIYK